MRACRLADWRAETEAGMARFGDDTRTSAAASSLRLAEHLTTGRVIHPHTEALARIPATTRNRCPLCDDPAVTCTCAWATARTIVELLDD